ncbi:MAG: methyltransferase, partial [Halobacteriovoraceae bacterium]|nr:methyltransferase [Halobacteriovoraceae bacterium]
MLLAKRFLAIKDFLSTHFELLDQEVLESFNSLPNHYKIWAKDLKKLDTQELIDLENNLAAPNTLNADYLAFLNQTKELTVLAKNTNCDFEIPQFLKRKLSLKKQHEIKNIYHQLIDYPIDNFIDIGSGAGHLSSILLHDNQKTSTCLDLDTNYQQIGIKKLKREAPGILERMSFKQVHVNEDFSLPHIMNSALLGLHACGNLS